MTKRKSRARKKPSTPTYGGDHGTGTAAAMAGAVLEPLKNDDGSNPNNLAQVRRIEHYERLGLSLRQHQAAQEIRDAYCYVEVQSSGDALKEKVDGSPRPDATVDVQTDAQSRLNRAMRGVPAGIPRRIVEHVLWHNQNPDALPASYANVRAQLKITLDLVANKLGY